MNTDCMYHVQSPGVVSPGEVVRMGVGDLNGPCLWFPFWLERIECHPEDEGRFEVTSSAHRSEAQRVKFYVYARNISAAPHIFRARLIGKEERP